MHIHLSNGTTYFQWPWVTLDPDFKVTTFLDIEYLRNDTRYRHSYHRTSIEVDRMRSIEWWCFQWPRRTSNPVFKVKVKHFWSRMSQKRSGVGSNLQVGGRNAGEAPAEFFLMCSLTFLLCPRTWGGTTIVCYRLRDNWSSEVGRGAKVMGPSTYSNSYSQHF